ncbi:hypothetical protein EVAR_91480_1 [Eumeta japonica]|uniref:Uncharacterized protein n=1 Tax=Eumeta variegata TaxID=151549 RepID=A0A4C1VBD5_EUMVA|nr:hypothetical protein EVAR_91480_1 [Eumeta japonica]
MFSSLMSNFNSLKPPLCPSPHLVCQNHGYAFAFFAYSEGVGSFKRVSSLRSVPLRSIGCAICVAEKAGGWAIELESVRFAGTTSARDRANGESTQTKRDLIDYVTCQFLFCSGHLQTYYG